MADRYVHIPGVELTDSSIPMAVLLESYNKYVDERKVKTLSKLELEYVLQRLKIEGMVLQDNATDDISYQFDLTALKKWMHANHYMRPEEPKAEASEGDGDAAV